MKQTFFNSWIAYYRWIGLMLAMLSSIAGWGQEKRNAVEELVEHGLRMSDGQKMKTNAFIP